MADSNDDLILAPASLGKSAHILQRLREGRLSDATAGVPWDEWVRRVNEHKPEHDDSHLMRRGSP